MTIYKLQILARTFCSQRAIYVVSSDSFPGLRRRSLHSLAMVTVSILHPFSLPQANTSPSSHAPPLIPRPKLSPSTQITHPLPTQATILLLRRTFCPDLEAFALAPQLELQALDLEARKPPPSTFERHLQCEPDRVCGQDLQCTEIHRGSCLNGKSVKVLVQFEGEGAVEDVEVVASALPFWLYDDRD